MNGAVTYDDSNAEFTSIPLNYGTFADFHRLSVNTLSSRTGRPAYTVRDMSPLEKRSVESPTDIMSPGVDRDFSIATRWVSGVELNMAFNGVAYKSVTDLTDGPDVSLLGAQLFLGSLGTLDQLCMWSADLGDAGIEEATA